MNAEDIYGCSNESETEECLMDTYENLEVIGNIHENPELISNEK